MIFLASHRAVFWRLPWSAPLRAALSWQADPAQFPDNAPPPEAPRWLRPLCVQRMVGRAVAQRAAWLARHPCLEPYRFGRESEPDWHECNLLTYDRRNLREMGEWYLRWMLGMEVERLLRLAQTAPAELGEAAWPASVLAASEHVAQVYHELRRRCKAARARAIVREELRAFLTWIDSETAACTDYGATFGEACIGFLIETRPASEPALASSASARPSLELRNTAPSTTSVGSP